MTALFFCFCVVMLTFASCLGQTLECFQCDLGFWDMCHTTTMNCSDGEQCFVGIGVAAAVLKIKMMGCLINDDCNKTTIVSFPVNKTLYKMTKYCCEEDYCNGGSKVLMTTFSLMAPVIAQIMCSTL
ncbi:sperm acrosome membrane-associated protein 4 [Clarias gariepinus]|uniref:sperm acrosome membrane-associated protein 4 n=1 Tax=Clarias gariepinus TaxID=13013 RepID=UPI00234DDD48|nr:sperm acrosome membrane-associated protein 4 [Clarias gariepinus]